MMRFVDSQLFACPFCGTGRYTPIGLRQHWCVKAPVLPGEKRRNQKGSRPLTREEWLKAVGKEVPTESTEASA